MKKLSMILVLLFSAFFITNNSFAYDKSKSKLKTQKKFKANKPYKIECSSTVNMLATTCPPGTAGAGSSYVYGMSTTSTCSENGIVICTETGTKIFRTSTVSSMCN
jgi:hypothetical protein